MAGMTDREGSLDLEVEPVGSVCAPFSRMRRRQKKPEYTVTECVLSS